MSRHWFFFVHIMKTAGTAFHDRLVNHFGDAVYPTWPLDGPNQQESYLSVDCLRERLASRGDQIRIITGHFPLRITESLDGRFTTLTLLRDPVQRMLSQLRSSQQQPLERAYDAYLGRANNNMTKMLALTADEMQASMFTRVDLDREHLERAKEALAGIDAVGLQARFEEFCAELTQRFGWDLGEPEVINASPPADVPESLRARIAADNWLDIELYDFAQELVANRATAGVGQ